jgi:hypothetical protein
MSNILAIDPKQKKCVGWGWSSDEEDDDKILVTDISDASGQIDKKELLMAVRFVTRFQRAFKLLYNGSCSEFGKWPC